MDMQERESLMREEGYTAYRVGVDTEDPRHERAKEILANDPYWSQFKLQRLHDQGNLPEVATAFENGEFVVYLPPKTDDFGTQVPGGGLTGFAPSQKVAEVHFEEWLNELAR